MILTVATESDLVVNINVHGLRLDFRLQQKRRMFALSVSHTTLWRVSRIRWQIKLESQRRNSSFSFKAVPWETSVFARFTARLLFQVFDSQTIASIGMADGDLLMLEQQPVVEQRTRGGAGALGSLMGQQLVERATANPELLSRIEAENPQLAAAIRSNDSERAMALLIEAGELAR